MPTIRLTVNMKATLGLILAFMIFSVAASVSTSRVTPVDVYLVLLTLAIVLSLLTVVFVFAWKGRAWAYAAAMVLGALTAIASAPFPGSLSEPLPAIVLWQTTLTTVLGLLIALEGFKAYTELSGAARTAENAGPAK